MKPRIIGLEGRISDDAVVVWGAAAVLLDERRVHNSLTSRVVDIDDLRRLIEEGHLHHLEKPLPIPAEQLASPLILVMVRLSAPVHRLFLLPSSGKIVVAKTYRTAEWQHYVFEDKSAFDSYSNHVVRAVMQDVLYSADVTSPESVERHKSVARNALGLAPSSPDLNALWAYLTPTPAADRVARSSVRGDVGQRRFDTLLVALKKSNDHDRTYQLKYERGAADGGGMDVDVAGNTLLAVNRASKLLHFPIRQDFSYLRRVPPPRLREMAARSAHMYFAPKATDHDLLGDRVARYLELELLERAIQGEVELPNPEDQRELEANVRKIVRPTAETGLRHKPLSEQELSAVDVPDVDVEEPLRSPRMDFVGMISGLSEDTIAELQLAPDVRVTVATDDDGDGALPFGADTLTRDRTFLRRPCLISLIRQHTEGSTPTFLLRGLQLLQRGSTVTATAIPSGVVPDAFVLGATIRVSYPELDRLTGDLGELSGFENGTLESATHFFEQLANGAFAFELGPALNGAAWLSSTRTGEATPLARVLTALAHQEGRAHVKMIRAVIQKRFGVQMLRNNTRREVLRNPELLKFDEHDPGVIYWTDLGAAYYQAYVKAGGATQKLSK